MIERNHPLLSLRRQCALLGLSRATFYRQPAGETPLNLMLMRLIDEEYTRAPFYGYRKLVIRLQQRGYRVNLKRVRRLMRTMGLQAVYPHPRTSIPDPQHKKYPYLLRDMEVTHPNQVWSADITKTMYRFISYSLSDRCVKLIQRQLWIRRLRKRVFSCRGTIYRAPTVKISP